MSTYLNQKGTLSPLLLLIVFGVLIFLAIAFTAPFSNKNTESTFSKSTTQAASGVFQEVNGQVNIEAENYKAAISRGGHQWVFKNTTEWGSFGGTGYLDAQPFNKVVNTTNYTTNSPELQYDINFTNTGTYYLWTRGRGVSGILFDFSIHGGLDGQPLSTASEMGSHSPNIFEWLSNRLGGQPRATITISTPGIHTLHIWMNHDGFKLDQIMLRKNPDTNFTGYHLGVYPTESSQTPSGSVSPTVTPIPTVSGNPTSLPSASVPTGSGSIFGNSVVGTSIDSNDSNYINASRYVTGATAGTITSMSVYVGTVDSAPNNQFQVGIYADSGGLPGNLIAKSTGATLQANSWNTVQINATLSPNTAYWLGYNTNGRNQSVNNMYYNPGGTSVYSHTGMVYGTWPNPFGALSRDTHNYSIYATFATSGAIKRGDIDNNGNVDIFDYNALLSQFGRKNDPSAIADLDNDDDVDIFDYNLLLSNFGK